MWKEFKEFALRGNVLDMAVGIIIGGAFTPIAKSLVDDVIMPPLGLLLGDVQFQDMFLVLKGGETVGPNLGLLEQFFPWYSVTFFGSFLGLAYGFAAGFVSGWGFAVLRNLAVFFYNALIHRRAERLLLRNLLEYV